METKEIENIEIGEDKPQVAAKKVEVAGYRLEPVKSKEGKEIGDKLVLEVKHPDLQDKTIDISSVKFMVADKLKTSGLWVKKDEDGKLPFRSAVATMLRSLTIRRIAELKGIQLDTVVQDNGYLAVKSY